MMPQCGSAHSSSSSTLRIGFVIINVTVVSSNYIKFLSQHSEHTEKNCFAFRPQLLCFELENVFFVFSSIDTIQTENQTLIRCIQTWRIQRNEVNKTPTRPFYVATSFIFIFGAFMSLLRRNQPHIAHLKFDEKSRPLHLCFS